jgi:hypothetical protein
MQKSDRKTTENNSKGADHMTTANERDKAYLLENADFLSIASSLASLKEEFENIEIPYELGSRIKASIRAARGIEIVDDSDISSIHSSVRKEARHQKIKKIIMIQAASFASLAACLCIVFVVSFVSPNVGHAMEDVPVIGSIITVTHSHFKSKDGQMSASVNVPEVVIDQEKTYTDDTEGNNGSSGGMINDGALSGSAGTSSENANASSEDLMLGSSGSDISDELNSSIKEYTDSIINRYKSDVKASDGKAKEDITSDYQVVTDNNVLYALRFDTTTTMADTGEEVRIYNVNKRTGKIISINDLFNEGSEFKKIINADLKDQMRASMKADPDKIYFLSGEDAEDHFRSINKDTQFYINGDNLNIVFDRGTIAPMYMGVCEFSIPLSELSTELKTEYDPDMF